MLQVWKLDLPFIVVSGTIGESQAVAAMKLGAHDYLMKGQLTRLLPAIARELQEARERHQRRQAEQALRDSEARFRSLIENTSDIILLLDAGGKIHYASSSVQRILGYAPEELVAQPLALWLHPDDRDSAAQTWGNALQRPDETLLVELRWQEQQGNWRVFEVIVKQFQDATGFVGTVVNARDITERLRMEEMRSALERERELSELKLRFFSMASHEFRTPLSIILLSAQVLENAHSQGLEEKSLRNIRRIQTAAQNLRQMIADVLTLGRIEAQQMQFQPQPFNLEQFCIHLLDEISLSLAANSPIRFTYTGDKGDVCLDKKLLHSILSNLLSNAIKYSSAGNPIDFGVNLQADSVIFTVRDRGIGIAADDYRHLFEAFYRGQNVGGIEGSGLGLAVVKKCVELHQGQITVESAVAAGTTFIVQIPLVIERWGDGEIGRWGDGEMEKTRFCSGGRVMIEVIKLKAMSEMSDEDWFNAGKADAWAGRPKLPPEQDAQAASLYDLGYSEGEIKRPPTDLKSG
jgi:PAS domain S-box-containing protein